MCSDPKPVSMSKDPNELTDGLDPWTRGEMRAQREKDKKNAPPPAPSLTDEAVQKARLAEARRLRGKRGRKSTFLSDYTESQKPTELTSAPVGWDTTLGGL